MYMGNRPSLRSVWLHIGEGLFCIYLWPETDSRSLTERRTERQRQSDKREGLGPISRKPRKLFGPVKPFCVHLYLKTEKCIRLKLLV